MRATTSRRSSLLVALFALTLIALVLQGASLPHGHAGRGFYNHDHDLTLLATLGLGATLPDVVVSVVVADVIGAVGIGLVPTPPTPPRRSPSSRAPPTA